MFKSIFTKYFMMTLSIVLICFVVLGVTFLAYTTEYLSNEKKELLYYNVNRLANHLPSYTVETKKGVTFTGSYATLLVTTSNALSSDVFITDGEGNLVRCSEGGNCVHEEKKVSKNIMDKILLKKELFSEDDQEYYYEVDTLDGLYSSVFYTVAMPLRTTDGKAFGAVFISAPAENLRKSTMVLMRTFIISSICIVFLSMALIYLLTYRTVRPLRIMSNAAKAFGDGDFSIRVPVIGHDEISQLCRAFNNMAESLSSSEEMRRSFIANVSHELKTPMTSISGFIDGILDGTISEEKRDYYLSLVSDEIKRLSRLVRTMLDLSRIEAGEVRFSPVNFDISKIIVRSLLSFEKIIEEKQIEIRGLDDIPNTMVYADPDLLHQVVYNLVDNAVKFTNHGGYIKVFIEDTPINTTIAISNSGIGIKSEDLRHVFERFYKTDKSRGLDKKGVGLGLFICKMFVNMHDGDISANSVEGEYCEFKFNIPKVKVMTKEKSTPKKTISFKK
jgi:Signal transduction histidine kinase